MSSFKNVLDQYCIIDNEINELNKKIYALREQRKFIENQMKDFMTLPEYSSHTRINRPDGSHIIINKPNQHYKSVSFSKGNLQTDIMNYFQNNQQPDSVECIKYVFEKAKERAICTEYGFTRINPNE